MQNKFEVGQTVLLLEHGRQPVEVVIEKVARLNVYIKRWNQMVAFDKITGRQKGNTFGYASRIVTRERLAWEDEHKALMARVEELGFEPVRFRPPEYTNTTLKLVIKALEGDADV